MAFAASVPVLASLAAPAIITGRPARVVSRRPVPAGSRILTCMSAKTDSDIQIRLSGNNIKITPALREYVDKKIGKVASTYPAFCSKIEVHLKVQPSVPEGQSAEVVIFFKKNIFRREEKTSSMYKSIDLVQETINRTMRKFKERKEAQSQKAGVPKDEVAVAVSLVDVSDSSDDELDDELVDTFASSADPIPSVPKIDGLVKRKNFPLPKQTIEEAILCLDYIDHDFYMFRLADSGKVSLVYRRNHGGYGLIEPDSDE